MTFKYLICEVCASEITVLSNTKCKCGFEYVVMNGVVVMTPNENYTDSFGFQWTRFPSTQIDSQNGAKYSKDRFFAETHWTERELTSAVVVDAGCGSGRFTEIAAEFCHFVIAVDLSNAIFAMPEHLASRKNLMRVHGDIRRLNLNFAKVTHLFSIGVLQHTPIPLDTLQGILIRLEPGTKFAFTTYSRRWYTFLHTKYLVRFITKRIDNERILSFLQSAIPRIFPILMSLVRPKKTRRIMKFILPIALYPEQEMGLDARTLLEQTILDTFDMLTPEHDHPLSPKKVKRLLEEFSDDFQIHSKVPLIFSGTKRS